MPIFNIFTMSIFLILYIKIQNYIHKCSDPSFFPQIVHVKFLNGKINYNCVVIVILVCFRTKNIVNTKKNPINYEK